MSKRLRFQINIGPDGRLPDLEFLEGTVEEARIRFFEALNHCHSSIDHAALSISLPPDDPSSHPGTLIPLVVIHRDNLSVLRYLISGTGAPAGEPWLPDDHPALRD